MNTESYLNGYLNKEGSERPSYFSISNLLSKSPLVKHAVPSRDMDNSKYLFKATDSLHDKYRDSGPSSQLSIYLSDKANRDKTREVSLEPYLQQLIGSEDIIYRTNRWYDANERYRKPAGLPELPSGFNRNSIFAVEDPKLIPTYAEKYENAKQQEPGFVIYPRSPSVSDANYDPERGSVYESKPRQRIRDIRGGVFMVNDKKLDLESLFHEVSHTLDPGGNIGRIALSVYTGDHPEYNNLEMDRLKYVKPVSLDPELDEDTMSQVQASYPIRNIDEFIPAAGAFIRFGHLAGRPFNTREDYYNFVNHYANHTLDGLAQQRLPLELIRALQYRKIEAARGEHYLAAFDRVMSALIGDGLVLAKNDSTGTAQGKLPA